MPEIGARGGAALSRNAHGGVLYARSPRSSIISNVVVEAKWRRKLARSVMARGICACSRWRARPSAERSAAMARKCSPAWRREMKRKLLKCSPGSLGTWRLAVS